LQIGTTEVLILHRYSIKLIGQEYKRLMTVVLGYH